MGRFVAGVLFTLVALAALGGAYHTIHTCQVSLATSCREPIVIYSPVPTWSNTTVTETIRPQPQPQPTVTVTISPTPTAPRKVEWNRVEYEEPKYRYDWNFTWSVCIGQIPQNDRVMGGVSDCEKWSGNGYPTVTVEFKPGGFGDQLLDTGMYLNAMVSVYPQVGFDFCGWHIYRFWKEDWAALAVEAQRTLSYVSHPVSDAPADYFQNGEKCVVAAFAQSYVSAVVCMEGDGEITKPWEEKYETDTHFGTIVHIDIMDYCVYDNYKWPI